MHVFRILNSTSNYLSEICPPTPNSTSAHSVCEHRAPSSSVIIMEAGAKKVTFLFLLKYDPQ